MAQFSNDRSGSMFDVHPFGRPFGQDTNKITVVKPYGLTGPILLDDEVPRYTWRVQDIMNNIISSGLSVKHVEEMYAEYGTYWFEESDAGESSSKEELEKLYNWKTNPLAAIPQWLSIYAIK